MVFDSVSLVSISACFSGGDVFWAWEGTTNPDLQKTTFRN